MSDQAAEKIYWAASEMTHASQVISEAMYHHRMFMDDWLRRFEEVLNKPTTAQDGTP